MDLIYLSENFYPLDVRSPSYGFYDRTSWSYNSDDDKTITVAEKHRLANLERQKQQQQKNNTQPCLLCLESKRRKLGHYFRQKSVEEKSIQEEEDEDIVGHQHNFSTESNNRQNKLEMAAKPKS